MKIISKIALVLSSVYLMGCSGGATDKIENEDSGDTPTQAEQPAQNPQGQTQAAGNAGGNGDVAVNPPHGEPGHDCDIAVGAPLDGSAQGSGEIQGQEVEVQGQEVEIQTQQGQQGTPQGVEEGLNPPHGEPGHDCEIPVGAPLNQ